MQHCYAVHGQKNTGKFGKETLYSCVEGREPCQIYKTDWLTGCFTWHLKIKMSQSPSIVHCSTVGSNKSFQTAQCRIFKPKSQWDVDICPRDADASFHFRSAAMLAYVSRNAPTKYFPTILDRVSCPDYVWATEGCWISWNSSSNLYEAQCESEQYVSWKPIHHRMILQQNRRKVLNKTSTEFFASMRPFKTPYLIFIDLKYKFTLSNSHLLYGDEKFYFFLQVCYQSFTQSSRQTIKSFFNLDIIAVLQSHDLYNIWLINYFSRSKIFFEIMTGACFSRQCWIHPEESLSLQAIWNKHNMKFEKVEILKFFLKNMKIANSVSIITIRKGAKMAKLLCEFIGGKIA